MVYIKFNFSSSVFHSFTDSYDPDNNIWSFEDKFNDLIGVLCDKESMVETKVDSNFSSSFNFIL